MPEVDSSRHLRARPHRRPDHLQTGPCRPPSPQGATGPRRGHVSLAARPSERPFPGSLDGRPGRPFPGRQVGSHTAGTVRDGVAHCDHGQVRWGRRYWPGSTSPSGRRRRCFALGGPRDFRRLPPQPRIARQAGIASRRFGDAAEGSSTGAVASGSSLRCPSLLGGRRRGEETYRLGDAIPFAWCAPSWQAAVPWRQVKEVRGRARARMSRRGQQASASAAERAWADARGCSGCGRDGCLDAQSPGVGGAPADA